MYIISNIWIVNEGRIYRSNVLIKNGLIADISDKITDSEDYQSIDGLGKFLLPGLIDDQVHFREPGLTQKGDLYTESKAAIAGGITSYMDMPNTFPSTTDLKALDEKFLLASKKSLANYTFYFGATNTNIADLKKININYVCGIKVFMGSSTGNVLVDETRALEGIFAESPVLIATHCEDEMTIRSNTEYYKRKYGETPPANSHIYIRSAEACFKSSLKAVELANKYGSKLHILHVSTAKELQLFDNKKIIGEKQITAEVCLHHLWFDETDYEKYGNLIKWNPSIKTANDKEELFKGLLNNKIDIIATDHAPHTIEEKSNSYYTTPSGGPMVQHLLCGMLEFYHGGLISLEKIVEKMCHNPAILFKIKNRGFIRKGYQADLVIVDINAPWVVTKENILYKCGWSAMENKQFKSKITHTFVNGNLAYENGVFNEDFRGEMLTFER